MHRFNPSKIRERFRLWRKARKTRQVAYEEARQVCAAAGTRAVARSYVTICPEFDCDLCAATAAKLSPEQIANKFARDAYRPEVFKAARDGALAGFAEYAEARR